MPHSEQRLSPPDKHLTSSDLCQIMSCADGQNDCRAGRGAADDWWAPHIEHATTTTFLRPRAAARPAVSVVPLAAVLFVEPADRLFLPSWLAAPFFPAMAVAQTTANAPQHTPPLESLVQKTAAGTAPRARRRRKNHKDDASALQKWRDDPRHHMYTLAHLDGGLEGSGAQSPLGERALPHLQPLARRPLVAGLQGRHLCPRMMPQCGSPQPRLDSALAR